MKSTFLLHFVSHCRKKGKIKNTCYEQRTVQVKVKPFSENKSSISFFLGFLVNSLNDGLALGVKSISKISLHFNPLSTKLGTLKQCTQYNVVKFDH